MSELENIKITITPYTDSIISTSAYDLDKIVFDLDGKINLLSNQSDSFDYLISIASGLLCGMLDILWVGEFSLERGRAIASDKIDSFVIKTANLIG